LSPLILSLEDLKSRDSLARRWRVCKRVHSIGRLDTGWRRLIGCLKLQVIFRKRATNYRALLRKMTYEDKASYDSTPPCSTFNRVVFKSLRYVFKSLRYVFTYHMFSRFVFTYEESLRYVFTYDKSLQYVFTYDMVFIRTFNRDVWKAARIESYA